MAKPKPIDWELVKNLCKIQCTTEEIAAVAGVCDGEKLAKRCWREQEVMWSEFYKTHSAGGKASLRRLQFKAATNGNASMLRWLGVNWLNQQDAIHILEPQREAYKPPEHIGDALNDLVDKQKEKKAPHGEGDEEEGPEIKINPEAKGETG